MCRLLLAFVIILLSAVHVSAQNRVIAGKVSAEDGSPLARASLTVRGSRIAISTTPDGRFSFSVPFNTGTLIVAASGYIDQEIPITTATNTFDIKLRKLPELIMDTAEIFVSMRSLVFDTAEIVFEESELVPER